MIALSISPLARGETSWAHVLMPPPDSPKTVTFRASPPNPEMLRRTIAMQPVDPGIQMCPSL